MLPPPPISTLFPYTTLFRSVLNRENVRRRVVVACNVQGRDLAGVVAALNVADRKSTRLNSSHEWISYAVFCLKKKKTKQKKIEKYMKEFTRRRVRRL